MSAEIIPFLRMEEHPNRILEWRRLRDVSQQQLADAVGVTKMSVSRMERGLQPITLDHLRAVAAVLRVSPAQLLSLADNPDGPRNDAERAILESYRAGSEMEREMIRRVADMHSAFHGEDRKSNAA